MLPQPAVSRAALPLVWASLFALPAAAITPHCLPAAAAIAAGGLAFAVATPHPCRLAGLCALPAVLASIEPPVSAPTLPRPGPVAIDGVVAEVVRAPHTGALFVRLAHGSGRVRVLFDRDVELLPGDRLRALGSLAPAAAPDLVPSLHATATTLRVEPGPPSLQRAAAAVRRALEVRLLELVPGEHGAMLASLVLGRGTLASPDVSTAHQATGLSHLLAVSGAHAAMLALLLGLRARAHRLEAGRVRTATALLLLLAYAAVTGGDPPVLRAVGTFALAALASRLGRPLTPVAGLAGPALATTLLQPGALLQPSFLLSYAAVIGLCVAARTDRPGRAGTLGRWFADALIASAWATMLTAPLTLLFFGRLAPWTVVLTPLLAPLVAVLLLTGLGLALLACVNLDLAAALAPPLRLSTWLYVETVGAADRLPGTPIHALYVPPPWALWCAAGAGLVWVVVHPRRSSLVGGVLVLALPHFLPLHAPLPPMFRLCAVGHGQTALLTTANGHQIAFDCGSLQHPALATRRLLTALERRHLDLLVITHADIDHHNGVPALLQQATVAAAVLPARLAGSPLAKLLAAHGATVHHVAPGERIEPLPGILVAVPAVPADSADNDTSAWVAARAGPLSILLCGDAEALGVASAMAQGLAVPADVLVLPHHGRSNPMALPLLERVRPVLALASADAVDGHTALGPIARAFGADLWVTGVDGSLVLQCSSTPTIAGSAGSRTLLPR